MKIKLKDYETKDVIRVIREWTGLTQEQFGVKIKRSKRTIQDYEAGKCRYYTDLLKEISEVYNIDITIEKK